MASPGPRLYDLFPCLAGSVADWGTHLPRIADMGFTWVQIGPIFEAGRDGDLYAPRGHTRLDPRFRGDAVESDRELIAGFTAKAARLGLGVMLDLVIHRADADADLAKQHPDRALSHERGQVVFDYGTPDTSADLVASWTTHTLDLIGLGIRGFRAVAAATVPVHVWRAIIAEARAEHSGILFYADTAGAPTDAVRALDGAGFDYLSSSARWWDYRSDWLLEQYDALRRIAPSIAFPEAHGDERLGAEAAALDPERRGRLFRLRYLYAATMASGVMMPFGYEWGFARRLDPRTTRPADHETPAFDLSGFVGAVNALRDRLAPLNADGPLWRAPLPGTPLVAMLRSLEGTEDGATLLLLNPDPHAAYAVEPGAVVQASGGRFGPFTDVTPDTPPIDFRPGSPVVLAPLEARLLHAAPSPAREAPRPEDGRDRIAANRLTIENISPCVDGGRFAVKGIIGDPFDVTADIHTDGTFALAAEVLVAPESGEDWQRVPMRALGNDRWRATVPLTALGRYRFTIEAWRDVWESWRDDAAKKLAAGRDIGLELIEGRRLIQASAARATGEGRSGLERTSDRMGRLGGEDLLAYAFSDEPRQAMARFGERAYLSRAEQVFPLEVERTAARFSAWFEIFPRSASPDPARPGTLDDVIGLLPMIADMGFDVLYFPPIHPIGHTHRKGRGNSVSASPDDPGVPYAIGSDEGGHDAVDPGLGTLDDLRRLVRAAAGYRIEIALDFAVQCSPDHPWIARHPEWFYWRPDGSIRYAENPPKLYQDIVNVSFYRDAYPALWDALRDIVLFWAEEGVRIFRVDNPHTKPFPFWEWLIREVRSRHPDTVFLSEAFTRPKPMRRLAKLGFSQSYTYFTWRNTKAELTDYLTELASETIDYLRPNFFASTPDILPPILVEGGRAAHKMRAALAATLSPAYGLYAPFILCEATSVPGKDEYDRSEKYEIRHWDWNTPANLRAYVARLNRIRRENPALWRLDTLSFHTAHDDHILFYAKTTPALDNVVLVAVNLDPHVRRGGAIEVPLWSLGLPDDATVTVEDLFTGTMAQWTGKYQHVWLDPSENPCAIWRIAVRGRQSGPETAP